MATRPDRTAPARDPIETEFDAAQPVVRRKPEEDPLDRAQDRRPRIDALRIRQVASEIAVGHPRSGRDAGPARDTVTCRRNGPFRLRFNSATPCEVVDAMKDPNKPATEPTKSKEDGALGDMDEVRGSPNKGTGGKTIDPTENPDPNKRERDKDSTAIDADHN